MRQDSFEPSWMAPGSTCATEAIWEDGERVIGDDYFCRSGPAECAWDAREVGAPYVVTDEQVRLLRRRMKDGKTQQAAAAAAGMSVRTARKWQSGPLPIGDQNRARMSRRGPA